MLKKTFYEWNSQVNELAPEVKAIDGQKSCRSVFRTESKMEVSQRFDKSLHARTYVNFWSYRNSLVCYHTRKIVIQCTPCLSFSIWYLLIIILETVSRLCSVKRVLSEISQNSQENTCARVSATLLKKRHWCRSFPVIFVKFLRTLFIQRTPLVAVLIV